LKIYYLITAANTLMSETKLNRIEIDTLIARLTAEKSGKDVKMT